MPKIPIGNPAKNVYSGFIFPIHKKGNELFNFHERCKRVKLTGSPNLQPMPAVTDSELRHQILDSPQIGSTRSIDSWAG
jgi:hypothetical protein